MISTPAISSLIRDNKTYRLPNDIHTGSKFGMISLEASLVGLYQRGLISRHEVLAKIPGHGGGQPVDARF